MEKSGPYITYCNHVSQWKSSTAKPFPTAGRARHSFHVSRRLAVSEVRLALPNFYNITIGIANVAARLAVFILWLCDKLGSPTSPLFIARLNVRNADIHEAAE